jgi:hypothetical protein
VNGVLLHDLPSIDEFAGFIDVGDSPSHELPGRCSRSGTNGVLVSIPSSSLSWRCLRSCADPTATTHYAIRDLIPGSCRTFFPRLNVPEIRAKIEV